MRVEQALLLGIVENLQRNAVLGRAGRVEKLGLAQNLAPGCIGQTVDAHEGCVANQALYAAHDLARADLDRIAGTKLPSASLFFVVIVQTVRV